MVLCEAIAARQEEALFVANDTVFILLGEQRPQIFAGATGASRVIGITNRRDACSKRYKAGAAVAKRIVPGLGLTSPMGLIPWEGHAVE